MKLLTLEMQNLASLQGDHRIDFEQGILRDSQIFCIVGPTGSGKSTILDAICLALYGFTPRYRHAKGQRRKFKAFGEEGGIAADAPANILTRGQKSAYSKLTFLANDGARYRAEWSVRFKQKNYDDPVNMLYRLVPASDGGFVEQEVEWKELQSHIIGLDFQQFLRTVLIAQGSFASFLTSDEESRLQLLEKLVDDEEIYRNIALQLKQEADKATEVYEEMRKRVEAYESFVLPEDKLQATQEAITMLEAHEKQLRERIKTVEQALTWYAEEEKLRGNLTRSEWALKQAQEDLLAIQPKVQRLELHDRTLDAVTLWRDRQQKQSSLSRAKSQLTLLSQELAKQQASLPQAPDNAVIEALEQDVEKLQTIYTLLTSEKWEQHRQHLHDGQPCPLCGATQHPYAQGAVVKEATSEMRTLLDGKKQQLSSQKKLREQAHQQRLRIESLIGQQKQLTSQVGEGDTAIARLNQEITAWLAQYNNVLPASEAPLTEETLVTLASATDNWNFIRQDQQRRTTALTQAQTTCQNLRQSIQEHAQQKPAEEKTALVEQQQQLSTQSRNAELIEHKTLLNKHIQAVQQMGALSEQVKLARQLRDDWKQITDAMGADGKTLRKIAQCYTLGFLVSYANAEIRKFNRRYELMHVPNSLRLCVIDHDRGDDVRETASLSGGETFIVSLGLALGLSSLSSHQTSFDNLFIDEGFGTLDAETLATVIDALSMMQSSQGKKVGVISHTDTMSERIATQIRVRKNGNTGTSSIEVTVNT